MADRTGFEPATSGVTGRHSNQLNYRSEISLQNFSAESSDSSGENKNSKHIAGLLWVFFTAPLNPVQGTSFSA